MKNWKVFENDEQINNFLTLDKGFSHNHIDVDANSNTKEIYKVDSNIVEEISIQILHPTTFTKQEVQDLKQMDLDKINEEEIEVIDLKDNHLPKGLTPLEDLFDSNDIHKKPNMEPLKADIEEYNLGIEENPKMIKLSKSLPPDQKLKYVELMKEFQDVFAWSYDDLKSYDTTIIQHTIPLKEDQKPFKQKFR